MKAIRVEKTGGPDVLRYADAPEPTPGPGELLIDVEAIGVNFIEIYRREGLYAMQLPYTPGEEAAGVVRQIGSGVTDFAVVVSTVRPSIARRCSPTWPRP